MGTKVIGGIKTSAWRKLTVEKGMIESHFPCFRCNSVTPDTTKLECFGSIKPSEYSITYKLRLEYKVWDIPRIYVVEPEIIPTAKIHIYQEGNLCLYYPKETPWRNSLHISNTILPWAAEWLVYYELFKIQGVWLGKSALHDAENKKE